MPENAVNEMPGLEQDAGSPAKSSGTPVQKTRRRRWGDRADGRRLRSLDPLYYVVPFIMKKKSGASNQFKGTLDITETEEYIRGKREEGLAGIGILHFLTAAYVRTVSQYPGINRFVSGQRIYARSDIQVNLSMKKFLTIEGQETTVKAFLKPTDTIYDVFQNLQNVIAEGKREGDSNGTDRVARALIKFIPRLLLKWVMWLLDVLDYFGAMPKFLLDVSPFHGSLFISDLGSVGLPPVVHHLYDFGNLPVFICFGTKTRKAVTRTNGRVEERVYLDYTVVMDERTADGFYFSRAARYFNRLFRHPDWLDAPPAEVVEDVE